MIEDIKELYPKIYKDIKEIKELIISENYLYDEALLITTKIRNNEFVPTADETGISDMEVIFNITPDPVTEDTEFRRKRLLNRFSNSTPYTLPFFKKKLDEILGKNNWDLIIDYDKYTITLESFVIDKLWALELSITVVEIIPANMVYKTIPVIKNFIGLSEEITCSKVTFNYKLGTTWVLGKLPFATYSTENMVKERIVPSIQPALLNNLALHTSTTEVSYAKINNTYDIMTLTKTSLNNVATIEYTVPTSSGLVEINNIKLYNINNEVLSDTTAYIPLTQDVTIKNKIYIEEKIT